MWLRNTLNSDVGEVISTYTMSAMGSTFVRVGLPDGSIEEWILQLCKVVHTPYGKTQLNIESPNSAEPKSVSGSLPEVPDSQQLKQSIRGICESVNPYETNVEILQSTVNKIYAICCRT